MEDPTAVLDRAVEAVRGVGMECEGWTLQSSSDGYAAWLYRLDEEERQIPLVDAVDAFPTADEAARSCERQMMQAGDFA